MKNLLIFIAFVFGTTLTLNAQDTKTQSNDNQPAPEHGYYGHNDNRGGGYYGGNNNNNQGGGYYGDRDNRDNGYYGGGDRYNNDRRRRNRRGNGHGHGNGYGNGHGHGNGYGHGHGHGHGHNTGHGHGHHAGHGHGTGHRYLGYCRYTNHNFGWRPAGAPIFNNHCQSIRRCGFDSDRLRQAMYFADNNYLNACQIADIMRLFSFESTKLQFAKYAFHRTCDVQNYGLVFNSLGFNSSRRELDCYIRDYRW